MFKKFTSYFFALLLVVSNAAWAAQHPIVALVKKQLSNCGEDYYFSNDQIHSKLSSQIYSEELQKMAKGSFSNIIKASQVKDLNLIPVNNCVLRGNRHFCQKNNEEMLKSFQVASAITMDETVDKKYSKSTTLTYFYLPVIPKKYPRGSSLNSIVEAINHIAKSDPEHKTYISCFFGKHRTGLIIGLYQFLRNYAQEPSTACHNIGTEADKAFTQMNAIAEVGFLTYDMPAAYIKFYRDFAQAVCEGRSKEFLLIK